MPVLAQGMQTYQHLFLEAILASSIQDSSKPEDSAIPTDKEYLLDAIANALIAIYTGIDGRELKYMDYEYRTDRRFEAELEKHLAKELAGLNGESKVLHDLKEMVAPRHFERNGQDCWTSGIYEQFSGPDGILDFFPMNASMLLPDAVVERGREFIAKSSEKDVLFAIGSRVRKYINEYMENLQLTRW